MGLVEILILGVKVKTVIVICGNYRLFIDFCYHIKIAPMYDVGKNKGVDVHSHGQYCIIDDVKYMYSRDPEKLRGIDRGTEYILLDKDNPCYGHDVLTRFKRIEHGQV